MRTHETNRILWEHLGDENGESVTEFKHKDGEWVEWSIECGKCKSLIKTGDPEDARAITKYNDTGNHPCPIPDQYPGSDADVAEDIRVWMEKADEATVMLYFTRLEIIWESRADSNGLQPSIFEAWLLFICTPQDKIKAFIKVMKEKAE
jgi:hypothetical protein